MASSFHPVESQMDFIGIDGSQETFVEGFFFEDRVSNLVVVPAGKDKLAHDSVFFYLVKVTTGFPFS